MESKYLLFEGKEIFYQVTGNGEPLVLVHGYQTDSSIWTPLIPLLKNRFRLIIPDLPGHGRSPLTRCINDMDFLAEVVYKVSLSQGFKGVSIAGHSMGGYVALSFAKKYPMYTDKLVLINAHPLADKMNKVLTREREADLLDNGKKALMINGFINQNFSEGYRFSGKETINKFMESCLRQPTEGMLADLAGMMARRDTTEVALGLREKILVIYGSEDKSIPVNFFEEYSDSFEICEIPDCGHMSIVEKPDIVSDNICKNH